MYGIALVVTLLIFRENVIIHLNRFKALAIKNISKLFSNVTSGRINIRICRDITGEMWFGVGRYSQHKKRFILLPPNYSCSYMSNHFFFAVNNWVIIGENNPYGDYSPVFTHLYFSYFLNHTKNLFFTSC